jgi:hypothetical protein
MILYLLLNERASEDVQCILTAICKAKHPHYTVTKLPILEHQYVIPLVVLVVHGPPLERNVVSPLPPLHRHRIPRLMWRRDMAGP